LPSSVCEPSVSYPVYVCAGCGEEDYGEIARNPASMRAVVQEGTTRVVMESGEHMSRELLSLNKVLTKVHLREVEQQFGRISDAPRTLPDRVDVCWSLGFSAAIRLIGWRLAGIGATRGAGETSTRPPREPTPEWLVRARAQGRAEAFELLQGLDAATFTDTYIGEHAIADTGDYDAHWNLVELRQALRVDDDSYSLIEASDAAYWEQQAELLDLKARGAQETDAPHGPQVQCEFSR
jgi:hypothetical protein